MKNLLRSFVLFTLVCLLASCLCVYLSGNQLDLYIEHVNENTSWTSIDFEGDASIRVLHSDFEKTPDSSNHRIKIRIQGDHPGKSYMHLSDDVHHEDHLFPLWVSPLFHTVVNLSSLSFSGCQGVLIIVSIYFVGLSLLLLLHFFYRLRHDFYSYRSALIAGAWIFTLIVTVTTVFNAVLYLQHPEMGLYGIYSRLPDSCMHFIVLTSPLLILLGIALVFSNISLVRHEGLRIRNLLGVVLMLLIVGGLLMINVVDSIFTSGSFEEYRSHRALTSVFTSTFALLEAMLWGTMICGLIAAHWEPSYDKDFVIIHGCQIAKDGRPLPLLMGRIQRAAQFAAKQKAVTGKAPILIASGGKGKNEIISEAECISNTLKNMGFREQDILMENTSVNTLENILNSKMLIDQRAAKPKVAFATTNYHVFRCGVLAAECGMQAEGMGSKTKWYFWPNAFIREFVGLLSTERRPLAIWLSGLIVFFVLLSWLMV